MPLSISVCCCCCSSNEERQGYNDQNYYTDREFLRFFTALECEGPGFVKAIQFGIYFLANDLSTVFFNCS